MSEGGEKTELPTPKKQRDAREQGQVARSQEVVSAVSLLAVIAYVWMAWGSINTQLIDVVNAIPPLLQGDFATSAQRGMLVVGSAFLKILAPILGVTIFAAVASNVGQFGFLFAMKSLTPSLDKISPMGGFKKIFSMKQLVELLKSVLKIVILSILLYLVLVKAVAPFSVSVECGLPCQANLTSAIMTQVLLYTGGVFIVVAVADFAYQRHTHTKSLMMSKDEIKREYKESEGDPHIKGKRKQIAHELAMGDGGTAARKGTAVVVNPTHFAVVLSYEPEKHPLPRVTAKGRELQAVFLRTQAELAGVPVFRHQRLARGLYADTGVDESVGEEWFDVVAEVLAWVARNRHLLYSGPLGHGVIDMEAGDHRPHGQQAGQG